MKTALLTFIILFSCVGFVLSQDSPIDKGVIFLKGGSNLNIDFSDGTPINLDASGAYFLFDKIPIGLRIDYFKTGEVSNTTISAFTRYYLKEEYFGGISLFKDPSDNLGIGLEAGYVFYLNDYVSIEPTLNYQIVDGGALSLQVGFGIYY